MVDARRAALATLVAAMHDELAALRAGEVATIEAATAAKLDALRGVHATGAIGDDPQARALAVEATALNDAAGLQVNLLTARTERRLGALAAAAGHAGVAAYGRDGRLRSSARPADLDVA